MKVYDMVFGPQGSTLHYAVNIIGIYKTEGTIFYKEKKFQYREKRYASWQDGLTAYQVDTKKKTVNIYRYDDEAKDKYLSKFKFEPDQFSYGLTTEDQYHYLTIKLLNAKFFGIKSVDAKIRRDNLSPESLTIKMGFMKTTVQITDFRSGNVPDSQFVFPRDEFRDYAYTDHR